MGRGAAIKDYSPELLRALRCRQTRNGSRRKLEHPAVEIAWKTLYLLLCPWVDDRDGL